MPRTSPSPSPSPAAVSAEGDSSPPAPARTPAQAARAPVVDRVALLEVDPELAGGLPAQEAARAQSHLVAARLTLPEGRWAPPRSLDRALSLLVVRGLLVRDWMDFGYRGAQLFGPGDVFDARLLHAEQSGWRIAVAAEVVVLDARLLRAARHWPAVLTQITRRLLDAQNEQHAMAAVAMLPRVEDRLLALLGHLSERWGHATPEGRTLDLPLTHELLGRVVGARRPTVSLALAALGQEGLVARLPDGRWLLPARSGAAGVAAPEG